MVPDSDGIREHTRRSHTCRSRIGPNHVDRRRRNRGLLAVSVGHRRRRRWEHDLSVRIDRTIGVGAPWSTYIKYIESLLGRRATDTDTLICIYIYICTYRILYYSKVNVIIVTTIYRRCVHVCVCVWIGILIVCSATRFVLGTA